MEGKIKGERERETLGAKQAMKREREREKYHTVCRDGGGGSQKGESCGGGRGHAVTPEADEVGEIGILGGKQTPED